MFAETALAHEGSLSGNAKALRATYAAESKAGCLRPLPHSQRRCGVPRMMQFRAESDT